jgi:hypothetical protein
LYQTKLNKLNYIMSEQESIKRLKSLFDQIHFTVLYEKEILLELSKRELLDFRDKILDEIIFHQRFQGLRK